MAEYLAKSEDLTAVADAIRAKGGTDAQLTFPDGFAAAVQAIPTGATITDGFVVTARDADGLVAAADVYFSHIQTGVFGFTYTGGSAGAFTIMAQKAQTINFVVPVISVDNGAFRGNRSPASQIEKVFPTITKDGDGSFTNSLIENAYLPLLVDSYGNEFEGCSQLRTINIPLAEGEIKQWFCSNCTRLTSLYAPRKTVIGTKSINHCQALKTVEVGSIGYAVTAIDNQAFLNDTQIELAITIYTSGDYVDTAMANIRNSATRATIIIRAAADTTYNGAACAAGDTILTSTPEAST